MRRFFALFAVLAVVVAGCSSDDDDKSSETTAAQEAESDTTDVADAGSTTTEATDGSGGTGTTEEGVAGVSGTTSAEDMEGAQTTVTDSAGGASDDAEVQAADFTSVKDCDQLADEMVTAIKGIVSTVDAIPMDELATMSEASLQAQLSGVVDEDAMTAARDRLDCDEDAMGKKVCEQIVGIEAGNMISQTVVAQFSGSCGTPQ